MLTIKFQSTRAYPATQRKNVNKVKKNEFDSIIKENFLEKFHHFYIETYSVFS